MHSSKSNSKIDLDKAFTHLCETIAALRHPATGCPWDLEQTHATLRKYMIEEAYEAAEVMEPLNQELLCEELGDVLLQVVLNSQLASEKNDFSIADVIAGIDAKMRRRHPHVFGDEAQKQQPSTKAVIKKWDDIKKAEKEKKGDAQVEKVDGVFSTIKPGTITPALQTSVAIGKLAKKIKFDWPDVNSVMQQFKSEIAELEYELTSRESGAKDRAYKELGDVFFSLGQLCRHMEIDPEICALDGNRKFLHRFKNLEEIAKSEGINVTETDVVTLERLWEAAKAREKALKF